MFVLIRKHEKEILWNIVIIGGKKNENSLVIGVNLKGKSLAPMKMKKLKVCHLKMSFQQPGLVIKWPSDVGFHERLGLFGMFEAVLWPSSVVKYQREWKSVVDFVKLMKKNEALKQKKP